MLSPETRPAIRAACVAASRPQQRLDALVRVAEPLLQPHHGLAVAGEAEMPGLDDAGMHRADRDLVQVLALDRQECIGCRLGAVIAARGACPAGRPVRARTDRARAFQPDRRRVQPPDRRIASVGAGDASATAMPRSASSSAICTCPGSPQRPSSVSARCRARSAAASHAHRRRARPRPMASTLVSSAGGDGRHGAIRAAPRRAGTRRPAAAGR